jgi:hypothetical protein
LLSIYLSLSFGELLFLVCEDGGHMRCILRLGFTSKVASAGCTVGNVAIGMGTGFG